MYFASYVKEFTEKLIAKVEECHNKVRYADYYVKKLAVEMQSSTLRNEFGYNDMKKLVGSPKRTFLFMKEFCAGLNRYSSELIDVSFTEEKQASFEQITVELDSMLAQQTEAMNERHRTAELRVGMLNDLWAYMGKLAKAVEHACPNDAIAQNIFSMPRKGTQSMKSDSAESTENEEAQEDME